MAIHFVAIQIATFSFATNFITLPLTGFAKGVYVVKITTADNKVTTKKIIKGL